MHRPRDLGWMAAVTLLALALRCAVWWALPFDGLYGQDAFAYYDYAVGPLRAALQTGQALPAFFWPPGYPLLIALGSFAAGVRPLVGQWISLAAGSLAAGLTYGLGRELGLAWRPPTRWPATRQLFPLCAGLLVALHPQLWQSSLVVMADTVGLAAATLGAWAVVRYSRTGGGAWLWLSSAATAYAVLTRWAYALVAVPIALVALARLAKAARAQRWAAAGLAAGALLVAGLVLAPVLPALASPTAEARAFAGDLEVYSWQPANALRREFVTVDGLLRYRLPNGLYYGLMPAHPYYFTPLLAVFLLPGVWRLRTADPRWPAWALLVGWPVLVLGFHAGAPWQNFRFGLAALPPLALLAAIGIEAALAWGGSRWRWLVAAVVLAGMGWQAWGGWQLSRAFAERKQRELSLVEAVEAQAPAEARLLTFGLTPTFAHYSRLQTHELWALTEADLAALLADPTPTFVLLDLHNVETQWQGRSPSLNYHWLQTGPGLETLGTYDAYTLFRVRCPCP